MKKIVLILGLILILLPLVCATESIDIDFSAGPTQIVTMSEGDELRVFYNNSQHSIILTQINHAENILNFKMFINLKNFSNGAVFPDTFLRIDFERDLNPDISIETYEILDETTATIIVKDLQYQEPEITGNPTIGVVSKEKSLLKYLLIGILILFGILGFRSFGKPTGLQVKEEPTKTEIPKEVDEEETKTPDEEPSEDKE